MKRRSDVRRLLRWYPLSWRSRYEEEFLALLEDRLDGSPPTIRFRSSVAIAGMRERCYASGIVGTQSSPLTQRRTGSLMVLIAWSMMAVGGAVLVKTAEHFAVAVPVGSRSVAQLAYNIITGAGILGTIFVACGALVALPAFARFVRAGRWTEVRGAFTWPAVATSVIVVATIGLSSWAHHLDSAQRNGSDHPYSGAFLAYALAVVVTLGLWARVSVAVASRIDLPPRALRVESWLAVAVSLASMVVVGSTTLWWVQMGLHAPWFLEGSATGVAASPWSVNLITAVSVMALATATALWGAARVAMTYRPTRQISQ
jgi:hypothetical protein